MPKKKITLSSRTHEELVPQEEELVPQEEELVPQEEESLQKLGQKIREERISKNLSLESVSGHLHIAVKILEAIEEGNPKKGPNLVFMRGLVRTYCHYLGLDKTNIADKIENILKSSELGQQQLKTLKPVIETRESHPIRKILTVLVLVTGGYLLYLIYFSQIPFFLVKDNRTKSKSAIVQVVDKLAGTGKINVTDDRIVASTESLRQSKQKNSSSENISPEYNAAFGETSSAGVSSLIRTNTSDDSTNTPDTFRKKIDPVEQYSMQPLTLEVEASEGTWISISVDGNKAKDIRLNTDEIHQWQANKEYLLTLGNTNAVRILLNGREIETNRTHQLLTDWVIDKSFLP